MTSSPISYDPNAPSEQADPPPSAPSVVLSEYITLQPPLTCRGTGPGIIVFLPRAGDNSKDAAQTRQSLDPEPMTKWAEEGFAVVGITASEGLSVDDALNQGLNALKAHDKVDVKDKFGVIVYEPRLVYEVSESVSEDLRVSSLIGYGSFTAPKCTKPTLLHITEHLPQPENPPPSASTTVHTYSNTKSVLSFVPPHSGEYDEGNAAVAHTRTLGFLRKSLGGPFFDLGAVWDKHTHYELEERSLAKTLGTMVAEPYVYCIPTLCGGIGKEGVKAFYRDYMIFCNSADVHIKPVHRTVSEDRVTDEFIFEFTHDRPIPWVLPGIPPTGKKLSFPMLDVIAFRGDRIFSEHVWWDHANALMQAGILPSHITYTDPQTGIQREIRLPIAGTTSSEMLINVAKGRCNQMLDPEWIHAPSARN